MNIINIEDLPWERQRSPTGKFDSFCRNVSLALGAKRDVGTWAGGHPFDLQVRRVPPGAAVCPLHAHEIQAELFVVLAGTATVRVAEARHVVNVGDAFYQAPRTAHQIINTGGEDFIFYVIADNSPADSTYYPDSNKWAMKPQRLLFRTMPTDYFDGEDEGAADVKGIWNQADFYSKKTELTRVRVEDLSWEEWTSPQGKFKAAFKQISEGLGAKRNTPTGLGGHPFDLELNRLRPGGVACPFHSHAAQWEMFIILQGEARIRAGLETRAAGAGAVVMHPPGEAHQIANGGSADLLYYIVTDNPLVDLFYYPDSDKWGGRPLAKHFRMLITDYEDGE